jgi:hypothetical protein
MKTAMYVAVVSALLTNGSTDAVRAPDKKH